MKVYKNPPQNEWTTILQRPEQDISLLYGTVAEILQEVKDKGDKAVLDYTQRFDGASLSTSTVDPRELSEATDLVPENLKKAILKAKQNIEYFHAGQKHQEVYREIAPGVSCWQKAVAIERVGLYIPGGSAPLLSTALMLGIPARMAGCKEIVMCTPPGENGKVAPAILFIAGLLGIEKVYKIGGVQAIAAMVYGTESIPAVDKLFGPGNQYVTAAKQLVSRDSTAIDMPAGPSELMVMADESCVPAYVAADLLSQAEHGTDSQVVLVSDDDWVIEEIIAEIATQVESLPRKDIAKKALENSRAMLLKSTDEMLQAVNMYAPEHLIIACEGYREIADRVLSAGSIFLGNYSPESAGDYASGTNHTLPTNGWARAYSGLNMDAFVKKITFQEISKEGLLDLGDAIITMAEAEELQAHSEAVKMRIRNMQSDDPETSSG